MDMSEIEQNPVAPPPENQRWHELVSEMGAEIAFPLTSALERINALMATGRIDIHSLRALREEVDAARHVGMIGQQLTRFASGRLPQSLERLQLADVLNSTLAHRSRETQARGVTLKPSLKPAQVIADASLLFSLLNTTIDWALVHAHSQIEFAIDVRAWPAHARLACRFAHRPDEAADANASAASEAALRPGLDSLAWRLIEQTAWTMGLAVERLERDGTTTLSLEFPRTVNTEVEGVSALEIDDGFSASANSQPLAGSHVLVVASRRELRMQIRNALREMSLLVDFVNSVEEAAAFCREGWPHAVVFESIQNGERFARFRNESLAEVPDLVFIEIVEEGHVFEMAGFGGSKVARVGRAGLARSLPSALMFELSKSL